MPSSNLTNQVYLVDTITRMSSGLPKTGCRNSSLELKSTLNGNTVTKMLIA
jgi:hypothetical protein